MNFKNKMMVSAVVIVPFFVGCSDKYVVTDKGDGVIGFIGINSNNSELRVMKFEEIASGMDYYNHINVGDTLVMQSSVALNLVNKNYNNIANTYYSNIEKINGKRIEEILAIERQKYEEHCRDSIINKLRQVSQGKKKSRQR